MFFNSLDGVLQRILEQPAWKSYRDYRQIASVWDEFVSPQAAKNSKPLHIERDTLLIATSSAVWAQEIALQSFTIINRINARCGTNLKKIRCSPARWQDLNKAKKTTASNVIPLQEVNLQKALADNKSSQSKDAKEQVKQLLAKIKTQADNTICPQCQTLTSTAELKRWQKCRHCAAQQWHDEYRPPS